MIPNNQKTKCYNCGRRMTKAVMYTCPNDCTDGVCYGVSLDTHRNNSVLEPCSECDKPTWTYIILDCENCNQDNSLPDSTFYSNPKKHKMPYASEIPCKRE